MSYRRREGRGATRRKKVSRVEMARAMTRSFSLYERNRLRKTRRRLTLLGMLVAVAGIVGWLVA